MKFLLIYLKSQLYMCRVSDTACCVMLWYGCIQRHTISQV